MYKVSLSSLFFVKPRRAHRAHALCALRAAARASDGNGHSFKFFNNLVIFGFFGGVCRLGYFGCFVFGLRKYSDSSSSLFLFGLLWFYFGFSLRTSASVRSVLKWWEGLDQGHRQGSSSVRRLQRCVGWYWKRWHSFWFARQENDFRAGRFPLLTGCVPAGRGRWSIYPADHQPLIPTFHIPGLPGPSCVGRIPDHQSLCESLCRYDAF